MSSEFRFPQSFGPFSQVSAAALLPPMMCRFPPPEPSGDYLEQEIQVDPRRITIETDDRSGYHRIRAEGMTPVRGSGNEGAPDLPGFRRNLLLPPGMRIAEVSVVASERTRIEGEFVPEPVPSEDGDRLPDSYYYDDREGAVFPVEPAAVIANDALRGIALGDYVVVPFEWDPTERALYVYQVLDVQVRLEPRPIAESAPSRLRPGRRFSRGEYELDWVRRHVENPEVLESWYASRVPEVIQHDRTTSNSVVESTPSSGFHPADRPSLQGSGVDMVILTNDTRVDGSSAGNLTAVFEEHATWRTVTGTPTVVRTVDWVRANYPGRDDAERIRTFLREAYSLWGTDYVLVGGDVEVVQGRLARATPGNPPSNSGNPAIGRVSDWYYAGLDAEWGGYADGYYLDGASSSNGKTEVDQYAELWVGRIPARDSTEAAAVLAKTYTFEHRPGYIPTLDYEYYTSALLAAGFTKSAQFDPGIQDSYKNGIFLAEQIRDLALDGYTVETYYPDLAGSVTACSGQAECYQEIKDHFGGPSFYPPDQVFTGAAVRDGLDGLLAIGDGDTLRPSLIFHMEHSNRHRFGGPSDGTADDFRPPVDACVQACFPDPSPDCSGWQNACVDAYEFANSDVGLDRDLIRSLDNGPAYFVGLSEGSETGAFDQDAVAEHLVRDPDGGAVAFAAKSHSAGSFGIDEGSSLETNFYPAIVVDRVPLGTALALSTPGAGVQELFHLFGDPTVRAWSAAPAIGNLGVEVDPPQLTNSGIYSFTIEVLSGTVPAEGARVCLSREGDIYAVGETDSQGFVTFPAIIVADVTQEIDVWVRADNQEPVHTVVEEANYTAFDLPGNLIYEEHFWTEVEEAGVATDFIEGGDHVGLGVVLTNQHTSAVVPEGLARLYPSPRIRAALTIDNAFVPERIAIGRKEGHPPAYADTFEFVMNEFGIRPELPPASFGSGYHVWRDLGGDYHVRAKYDPGDIGDSWKGILIAEGGIEIVDTSGLDSGPDSATLGVADTLRFSFVGDTTPDEFVFRASAQDWITIPETDWEYDEVGIGESVICDWEYVVADEIPGHSPLAFTVGSRLEDSDPDVYNFSDFVMTLNGVDLGLVSYRVREELGTPPIPVECATGSTEYEILPLLRNDGFADADSVEVELVLSGTNVETFLQPLLVTIPARSTVLLPDGVRFCDSGETAQIDEIRIRRQNRGEWLDAEVLDGPLDPWLAANVLPRRSPAHPVVEPIRNGYRLAWYPPTTGVYPNDDIRGYHVYADAGGTVTRLTEERIGGMPFWLATGLPEHDVNGVPIAYRFGVSLVSLDYAEGATVWFDGSRQSILRETEGWPLAVPGGTATSVLLVDVDSDAELEIVCGGRVLSVWNEDGTPALGLTDGVLFNPVPDDAAFDSPVLQYRGELAAGDVDGDGVLDIAGCYGNDSVYVVSIDGDVWRAVVKSQSGPTLANFGGDGRDEIIVNGEFNGDLYVWNASANAGTGVEDLIPYRCNDPVFATQGTATEWDGNLAGVAAADLDFDAYDEIIQPTRGGTVFVWNEQTGCSAPTPTWQRALTFPLSTPVVARECTGVERVYVTSQHFDRYHVLNGLTGASVYTVNWSSVPADDKPWIWVDQDHPVALADLGSTSDLEAVSGRYERDPNPLLKLQSWATSATVYWKSGTSSGLAASLEDSLAIPDGRLVENPNTRWSPVIADIDDDGTYEALIAGRQGIVFAWEIEYGSSVFSGTAKPQWPVICSEEPSSPVVADIDDDGDQELVFVSRDGLIHRFELEGDDAPWPMAGYDVARTGFLERECGTRPADGAVADRLALEAAPAATGSAVRLSIPSEGDYEVRAYDVAGRLVRELFRGPLSAGQHEIAWNHQDEAAREVASGVYFLRVRNMGGNDEKATARSVIVR